MRVDTTVVETNIHYPTDSSLLGDGVRVLTRAMKKISEIAGEVGAKLRDRRRSVKLRVLDIARAARAKGPEPSDSTPPKQHCTVVCAVFDLGDCGSLFRSVNDFEQAGRAHAAANAHRDNAILRPAPPALDQDVAGKSRPGHPIRVAH
jgi:hypothetical protein